MFVDDGGKRGQSVRIRNGLFIVTKTVYDVWREIGLTELFQRSIRSQWKLSSVSTIRFHSSGTVGKTEHKESKGHVPLTSLFELIKSVLFSIFWNVLIFFSLSSRTLLFFAFFIILLCVLLWSVWVREITIHRIGCGFHLTEVKFFDRETFIWLVT